MRDFLVKMMLITVMLVCGLATASRAELGVGLGYPYISVKSDFIPEISAEIKYAASEGIYIYAGRGYWNFFRTGKINVFTGIEVGGIGFDTLDVKGTGIEYGAFIGGEYRIIKELGITLDIAPTVINLSSQNTESNGLEWVITTGIYLYLF